PKAALLRSNRPGRPIRTHRRKPCRETHRSPPLLQGANRGLVSAREFRDPAGYDQYQPTATYADKRGHRRGGPPPIRILHATFFTFFTAEARRNQSRWRQRSCKVQLAAKQ